MHRHCSRGMAQVGPVAPGSCQVSAPFDVCPRMTHTESTDMPNPQARPSRLRALRISVCCTSLALFSQGAVAANLLVDTTSDDGSAAFAVCDSDPGNGDCSLRGAINKANGTGAADTIQFAIPVSDAGYQVATQHWRFSPPSAYPTIVGDLTIDGYSQPGALENTNAPDEGGSNAVLKIELRGPGGNNFSGLTANFSSSAFRVRGLAIGGFAVGVDLSGSSKSIEGCFIGTDIAGNAASPNETAAVRATQPITLGGDLPAARNVISGNRYFGVWFLFAGSSPDLSVRGNLIGTNAAGTAVLPGQDYGIYANDSFTDAVIGGDTPSARNLFSGNEVNALNMSTSGGPVPSGEALRVIGNYFGTDWTGTQPLPNGAFPASPTQPQSTIVVFRAHDCKVHIGGDAPGEGNLIAFNAAAGVQIATCNGASILGNSFHANGIAVDLSVSSGADGATANDVADPDANPPYSGGNRLQNYPEIIDLVPINSGLDQRLRFRVDTAVSNATYPLRVDIATGHGGQPESLILTSSIAAVDAQQIQTVTFPSAALTSALVLSVTDADGNSSEFGSDWIFADDFDR